MSELQDPERQRLQESHWQKLVEENLGWLRGWVRGRVSDPELVHDICQDAFLKALRARGKLKDSSRFPAWLFRIATNTLRDHLRRTVRRRRRVALSANLDEVMSSREAPDKLEEREEAERLLSTVRRLPARYREPLLLLHARGLPYNEVAGILGISENAVQVRIFRARKMLRERLHRGGSSSVIARSADSGEGAQDASVEQGGAAQEASRDGKDRQEGGGA